MPRLPPVAMSPQTRLRARFCPGKTCSVATFFQSHSSSSATSCARPVSVPCPISERAMRTTQVLSGLTTTQALTSLPAAVAASADAMNGSLNPRARPPPVAAEPTMNLRRVELSPGLLHRVGRGRREPFDGDDPVAGFDRADRNGAGAPHLAVDMHRTGTALCDAAPIFCTGQAHLLADHPQEGGLTGTK